MRDDDGIAQFFGCLLAIVLWVVGLALPTLVGLWILDLLGIVEVWG